MKTRGFEIAKGWENKDIKIPERKTKNAAAYDIEAAEDTIIHPYNRELKPTLIPTGLKAYCQNDECYLLLSRSGSPQKGLFTPHGLGLIDADYYENPTNDGHFMVQVVNMSNQDVLIKKGERIAQVIFLKYLICDGDKASGQRSGGFGSSGD